MKSSTFFIYLLVVISTALFSCTKENADYIGTTKELIVRAQWSVDYYFEGQDKTAQFNNYKFNFAGNGILTADDGNSSCSGNWSMLTDAHRNDILKINISEAHLHELNDHWTVNFSSTGLLIMKGAASEMRLRKL